jgi:type I restriction enzyme M protein
MLNSETKRHIDNARQILVGVIPNPTSQINQITNALIYKFMDDMDQSAIKAGGEPSFFTKNLEKYSWTRIMDSRLGGQERLNLYSEALVKLSEAKHLPELFRNIFKAAFLPYRSPEVLDLFLKEIHNFEYSHSEELGNAYEYLLSIMSSQGDAGQFRTPRHIIDFIVNVVDPKKEDKILDPACGTGGFLVSAYKHILKQHDGKDENGKLNNEKPLTPDDRKKLIQNFEGYDVDPDMVRISQVNMYLHQFKNPKIYNYNTLSQEERWGEKFDVILANPPFMSPKGGVRPHSKFSVKSNRAEVLFVDYIMNHLKLRGRAGIIVPEGIIFQSANSYKKLRKNLVEDGLWAVISLPSGVFNPYSGVKTSILLFDNEIAKKFKFILFAKVNNDGYSLGAQRKEIDDNDLDQIQNTLKSFREYILKGKKDSNFYINYFDKKNKKLDEKVHSIFIENYTFVKKEKLSEKKEYNLTAERYREAVDYSNAKWPMVELGKVCEVSSGNTAPQDKNLFLDGKYPFYRTSDVGAVHLSDNLINVRDWLNNEGIKGLKLFKKGTILFPKSGASTFLNHRVIMGQDGYVASHLATILANKRLANGKYIYYLLTQIDVKNITPEQAYPSLKTSEIKQIQIPLPPLEIQEQIVAEIEQYQKVIDGAKQVAENLKPSFRIDPSWEMVELGEVCDFIGGYAFKSEELKKVKISDKYFPVVKIGNIDKSGTLDISNAQYFEYDKSLKKYLIELDDILIAMTGATVGKVAYSQYENILLNQRVGLVRAEKNQINKSFLKNLLLSERFYNYCQIQAGGGAQGNISPNQIKSYKIPLPPLEVQEQIVAEIEAEQNVVNANKELMEKMEKKVEAKIGEVWGV